MLPGLLNEREYYTDHYVQAILAGEVRPHVAAFEDSPEPPWQRLRSRQRAWKQLDRADPVALRRWRWELLADLGYEPVDTERSVQDRPIPLLGELRRGDGAPHLWLWPSDAEDPLDAEHEAISAAFNLESAPRFVLLLGTDRWVLADRARWAERRLLGIDWDELLDHRDADALRAVTALFHRSCLAGDSAVVDTLDESSHKHAFSVSEDLKYALRDCIEEVGNEALRWRSTIQKQKVYDETNGRDLGMECLRWMYRLLFVLYVEARPQLGYAPMGSQAYLQGYSFERLRDLETLEELHTDEARDGTTLFECIDKLFRMMWEGAGGQAQTGLGTSLIHSFRLWPLKSHLFDPDRTPLLSRVKLSNQVVLGLIKRLSYTTGQGKGRGGRISYATLGINQLGAVYESLLSFTGTFAQTDLYEVKPSGEDFNPLGPAFFVTQDRLADYDQRTEWVYQGQEVRRHPKGRFIYRQSGRERQKSASFYTPEVLTRCLVKYALKELLEDSQGRDRFTADQILGLTVVEPAMGSAAFLNEAINQLAQRYLELKQRELGETIPHADYEQQLQKVRMVIADNNVFGVDKNPVALELAEVSLWLNAIFAEEDHGATSVFVPWFGGQLHCGNSLVGCWRRVFAPKQLEGWKSAVPTRAPLGQPRDGVWHFLLPDPGMCTYAGGSEGKPIKQLCGDELQHIAAWKRSLFDPLDDTEKRALQRMSDAVDRLWDAHARLLAEARQTTTDPLDVWGRPHPQKGKRPSTTREKDRLWSEELETSQSRAASPYKRLKLALDYWCALWFWPLQEAASLPDRDEWFEDLESILTGQTFTSAQTNLFSTGVRPEVRDAISAQGVVDVDRLVALNPRLQQVRTLSERYRFFHWELELADVFRDRGGFDLVLGNPPWIPIQWKEAGVLGDFDPRFVLRKLTAKQAADRREQALNGEGVLDAYLAEHEEAAGTQAYLGAVRNYPDLEGVKTNLYKCFLPLSWDLMRTGAATGLLHPEGVYDDPKGGRLRAALYPRLRRHFQFANALFLFAEVHDQTRFSINVLAERPSGQFDHLSNLFQPATVDTCYAHPGVGPVPGIKDEENNWDTRGHADRIVRVGEEERALFARLFDEPDTPPAQARLAAVHSNEVLEALRPFSVAKHTLGGMDHFATFHFNETYAQHDGTIQRTTQFASTAEGWVVSGPHFFVGNPFYKTPRAECTGNSHYDVLDLQDLPDDYLPRTNYVPACSPAEYAARTPKVPWDDTPVTEHYRIVVPNMIGPASERTLQAAIAHPGIGHIHTVNSYTLRDPTLVAATWTALPIDFFIKATGQGHFHPNLARRLPVILDFEHELRARACVLNCLTTHYADLWSTCFDPAWRTDTWARPEDPRLDPAFWSDLTPTWQRDCALRTDYARRQALVEIDVLVAMGLGLSLTQLQTIYRVQFPVMRHYERDTWYDAGGRIVFTNSKGLVGVGLPRTTKKGDPTPAWNDVSTMSSGTVVHTVHDDTLPGGPRPKTLTYVAPWVHCDREVDYAHVWAHFEERFPDRVSSRPPLPRVGDDGALTDGPDRR